MKQSNFLSLNSRDIFRMLVMTLIAGVLTFTQETLLPNLNIPTEMKLMINYAIAYLIKNYFTKPSSSTITTADDIGGGGIQNPPKIK
jgi:hypothetical protein